MRTWASPTRLPGGGPANHNTERTEAFDRRRSSPPLPQRCLWRSAATPHEGDRFTPIDLGSGGESVPEHLGIEVLRHPVNQLGLATPHRGPSPQSGKLQAP